MLGFKACVTTARGPPGPFFTAYSAPLILQQSLLTMEEIQSVEETQIKERKCLLLKIRGGKQFVLQCDVSGAWCGCRWVGAWPAEADGA